MTIVRKAGETAPVINEKGEAEDPSVSLTTSLPPAGAAFSAGLTGGISTSIAVFCHELPHELGNTTLNFYLASSVSGCFSVQCIQMS